MEITKLIIEITIGIFAGYCCCYFISMKLINMEPEKVVLTWLEITQKRLEDEDKKH